MKVSQNIALRSIFTINHGNLLNSVLPYAFKHFGKLIALLISVIETEEIGVYFIFDMSLLTLIIVLKASRYLNVTAISSLFSHAHYFAYAVCKWLLRINCGVEFLSDHVIVLGKYVSFSIYSSEVFF